MEGVHLKDGQSNQEFMNSVRSWRYRLINRLGSRLPRKISLTEKGLMEAASRKTGLSDWGDNDFREPLKVLLQSYEADAHLNTVGRLITRRNLIEKLANRLLIRDVLKRHPEIEQVPIRRPVFIVGLPRTGTTMLHRLLAQDPETRTLQFWELLTPSPPPDRQSYETDPRRKQVRRGMNLYSWFLFSREGYGQRAAIHYTRHDSPEECIPLFMNALKAGMFAVHARLTRYAIWLQNQDMEDAYKYYRKQLQILLWRFSAERLVLKSPMHLSNLDALLKVFPDARLIWTHREPVRIIPSSCNLCAMVRQIRSDHLDLEEIGHSALLRLAHALDRGMQVRDEDDNQKRYLDLSYHETIKNPIRAVRKIYEFLGDDLSPLAEGQIRRWLGRNPKNKHGVHRYDLKMFGLKTDEVNHLFKAYHERFAVPFE